MQNFQLLDEIHTNNKTLRGVIDFVSTKYITFYDFSMNEDPYLIKVVLIWRSYFSHIRFSVFTEIYFKSLVIGQPVILNKKTLTSPIPAPTPKSRRKIERILPKNPDIMNFVENTHDHQCV